MLSEPHIQSLSFGGDMSASRQSTSVRLLGRHVAVRISWPATGTPVGVFGLQVSNDDSAWTDVPAALLPGATQPAGTAGSWFIDGFESDAYYVRVVYTFTSGGTGATPVAGVVVKE